MSLLLSQVHTAQKKVHQPAANVSIPGKARSPPNILAAFEVDDGVALLVADGVEPAVPLPLVVEVGVGVAVSFRGDMTLSKT